MTTDHPTTPAPLRRAAAWFNHALERSRLPARLMVRAASVAPVNRLAQLERRAKHAMFRHILSILAAFVCIPVMAEQKSVFRELPADTVAHMERQRAFVADLAARHALKKVTGTKADYDLIQEIVSKKLIGKQETWKLQALGIIFGDALISEEPKLHWMEVTDAWGTDPTVLYAEFAYQLNALTMISKRVEDGEEEPIVHALARTVLRLAREEGPKAGKR